MSAIPRFYAKDPAVENGTVLLDKKESRHALSVLRLSTGDAVEIFDGKGGCFSGVVAGSSDGRLRVPLNRNEPAHGPEEAFFRASLAISVIKPERMDWLIEKSCELGAFSIFPFVSERSVIRLSRERWQNKLERWQKIAIASCKQCGRRRLPDIRPVQDFATFLKNTEKSEAMMIPTLAVRGRHLREAMTAFGTHKGVTVMIGPEGDFSEKEVKTAVSYGAIPVDLGRLVLRSETAALYVLSALGVFRGGDS